MHANLREIAVANGVSVYTGLHKAVNCRGNGRCGTCQVEISGSNIKARNSIEEAKLKDAPQLRLACQVEVLGDLSVKTQG
jgi:ferredoxin